ncbi:MAG: hypothetical protein LBT92_01975 [Rickettsiales bacterium]|jgi:hypothetical protein|nr:hypothetical protein [Rickettsiales bacterium]
MFITAEPEFDIIVQRNGAVSIVLSARARSPLRPRLVHDGKNAAVMFRDGDEAVSLAGIPRPAFKRIKDSRIVQVAELGASGRLVWNYAAEVEEDGSISRRVWR